MGSRIRYWGTITFLIAALLFIVSPFVFSRTDPVFGIYVNADDRLDFDEAAALALRLDRLAQQIEKTGWEPEANEATFNAWVYELLPMYSYEGAVGRTNIPDQVMPVRWIEGMSHNHIGGRSDCNKTAAINYRYFNPTSHWYQDKTWIATLAHELAHTQQLVSTCAVYDSERIENTAQIVAWEVLAGLANAGNRDAAYTLIFELRNTAMRAASAQGNVDDLYGQIYDDNELARWHKAQRFWGDRPDELQDILTKYAQQPLDIAFTYRNTGTVHLLALSTADKTLDIDDLTYFLSHAESLVRGFTGGASG